MKIISRLHGRLGNVMFQIATNLFYAKKYNYEPSFCFSNAILNPPNPQNKSINFNFLLI